MSNHSEYDRQREAAKLEQQRQEALRKAAGKGKTPEEIRKDQEVLNAYYAGRKKAMNQRSGGDSCALLLVAGAGGLAAVAAGLAAAARAFI